MSIRIDMALDRINDGLARSFLQQLRDYSVSLKTTFPIQRIETSDYLNSPKPLRPHFEKPHERVDVRFVGLNVNRIDL